MSIIFCRDNLHRLGFIISDLFGTVTVIPLILVLIFSVLGFQADFLKYFLFFSLIGLLIPFIFFLLSLKRGWVKDKDALDRKDRYVTYVLCSFCWGILYVVSLYGDWTTPVFKFLIGNLFFLILIISLMTFIFKISVHASINTFLYLLINFLWGWAYWWLFPVVLLVCWSRWINNRHSFFQLVSGILVNFFVWGISFLILLDGNIIW